MDENARPARARWWRRRPMEASGILRVEPSLSPRAEDRARPKLWRPPAALSLFLVVFALLAGTGTIVHHRSVDARLASVLQDDSAPLQIRTIKEDLAEQEMDEATLSRQLDTRLKYARAQKAQQFYLVLDTARRRFAFKYADKVVRDGCFEIGAPDTIRDRAGTTWTFPPVTGAFAVQEKLEEPDWTAPAWVFALNRQKAPRPLPTIPGGLGRYVLVFSSGSVIHSPPPEESPLKASKPGSFMMSEEDLAAIWRRVGPGTRIYIF